MKTSQLVSLSYGQKLFAKSCMAVFLLLGLSGCGFFGGLNSSGVQDRAPNTQLDPKRIKNAVPRVEAKSRGGNRNPYTVLGKTYAVLPSAEGFKERGYASWYGTKFHGRLTANGEKYDMYAMTAAHKHLPLPSYAQVKNLENGKKIIVRVNDRGPFHGGRIIDLSYAAATKLDMLGKGTAKVEVTTINTKQWAKRGNKTDTSASNTMAAVKISPKPVLKPLNASKNKPAKNLLYLQIGAFSQLGVAQTLQKQLLTEFAKEASPHRIVIHPTVSEQPIYRVRIGPLPDMQALESIKSQSALAAFDKMYAVRDPI